MIGTRVRKILRDVWSRKARTTLVSTSIFIGVFGTITLFTMGDLVVKQLEEDLDKNELAMVRSYVAVKDGLETANNETALAALRSLPNIEAVEGQAVYPLYWKKPADEAFESASVFAYSEPFGEIKMEPMRKLDGDYPKVGQNEIVVEKRFADTHGFEVGDEIVLRILSKVNGEETTPEETWRISGIVFFPYGYSGGFNPILSQESLFATYEDAQYISAFKGFSSFYVRYRTYGMVEGELDKLLATMPEQTDYIPIFTTNEDPEENSLIEFTRTTGNVLAILAILALIVSGFLVFNVISNIVTEQKRQIGVMKSVGASQPDNFLIYSGMAFVYGVIGVIPAVILAIPSGFFAAQGLAESANSLIEDFAYSPQAVILGIIMGFAIPVIASIIPVFNGTRVRILDAITDLGIDSHYGHGPIAHLIGRLPISTNIKQGISNVFQKKWRMTFTVIVLALAAGAFMGVFAVFASIDNVLNDFFDTFGFHFIVETNDSSSEAIILDNIGGLTPLGSFAGIAIEIEGYDKEYDPNTGPPALFATGYDPSLNAYKIKLDSGTQLTENPDGVILNRAIADAIEKEVGDIITIHAGGRSAEFPIVGIANYPFDSVWFDWRTLSEFVGFVDQAGNPTPRGLILVTNKEDPTAEEIDAVIDETNELLLSRGITADYNNIEQFIETISEQVATFRVIFNFTALLIALVGAVGLLTTLSMSVFERQKEIGVMRSVGAGSSTIIGQFLTEGLVVGLLAWLLGLPFSYFLSSGLIAALNLGDEYQLTYPFIAVVVGFIGTLVITTVASMWPSIAAARKTVSDILRYQ